jgi:chromosomal replication initiation ATPase DnaA
MKGGLNDFLLNTENALLVPVVQWIIDDAVPSENLPILFYGSVGAGKTKLLRIIIDLWKKNHARQLDKSSTEKGNRCTAHYLSASDFARKYAQSIESRTSGTFRQRCLDVQLLVVDDLEQIAEKKYAQTELRLLLDERQKKQLATVLAAEILPTGILDKPLVSRILAGTTILIKKNSGENNKNETVAGSRNCPGLSAICKGTAKHFGLKMAELKGTTRTKTIVQARSAAVYLSRTLSAASFEEIAAFYGRRDISTIRYLVGKVENAIDTDAELKDKIEQIKGGLILQKNRLKSR